jgi:PAS domain S-box-containing protein
MSVAGAASRSSALSDSSPKRLPQRLVYQSVVALAYVLAAAGGFELAFVAQQVTTVWAPTGIALAALLVGGLGLWPAVWAGALIANLGSDAPAWTAFVIATGNCLESVAAVWWLQKVRHFDATFSRIGDVLAFFVAVVVCAALAATIGTSTLSLSGVQPWSRFQVLWFDWWLGDALGAIVVGPAVVAALRHVWSTREAVHVLVWLGASVLTAHFIFGQVLGVTAHPIEFLVFPLVIGAAVVRGPAVTSWVVVIASVVAIWHTVHGLGPFAGDEVHRSLILLQAFMGVLAATSLLLAAAVAERAFSEQRERATSATLRHRQELLRLAQRAGGVATFEWNLDRQVAQCSSEFFRLFSLPAQDGEIESDRWAEFVHPDDRERMSVHLSRALDGKEPPAADYRITTVDGTVRWLSYAGEIQRTPEGTRMLGTVLDVTDRKRLEAELRHHAAEVERMLAARLTADAALRESRDVLALAMRGGSMGAWSRNLITNDVWWSRELEDLFGLTPGEFDRTEAGFFAFVHDDDRAAVERAVKDALERGTDYIVEFRFRHATGEVRWMEGRGRAVYDSNGVPETLYGIGIDVTERKRGEIALTEAKLAAESANRLKDQFLATLSHELRTPLNAILGYARLLRTNALPADRHQHAAEVIERNALAQNTLVEDLLDMSRIAAGKVDIDLAPVHVAPLLGEVIDGLALAIDAKRIVLERQIDADADVVTADRTRLQQVFWNVLSNAVKFTDERGRITVSLGRIGADVVIDVTDTGHGIAPEFLPFLFEPFRQGDSRFKRSHGGLGLGLTIAKQLVELHGGTIRARSDGIGRGSTFTILLPCEPAADDASGAEAKASVAAHLPQEGVSARSLAGAKILLVEDQEDTLTLFRTALEHAGADVRAVMSGAEALVVVEHWPPDLLVTDLGLPGMDGYELLSAMRSGRSVRCPAVAVSAYAGADDRSRTRAAGFHTHVAKPVDPATLVEVLALVLAEPSAAVPNSPDEI